MKNNSKDRASVPIPPPLIFFVCLGFGFFLEYLFPLRLVNLAWAPRIISGGIFFLISGYLAVSAFIILIKNKTPFDPARSTIVIVREGSFRFSRNPMYLSLLLLIGGITILKCSLWLFISSIVLFVLLEFFVVRPEEKYLSQKFGKEYLDYKFRVRRWI